MTCRQIKLKKLPRWIFGAALALPGAVVNAQNTPNTSNTANTPELTRVLALSITLVCKPMSLGGHCILSFV